MASNEHPKFLIVGGGLGGALAAAYLGQAGYHVEVYEMRPDPRATDHGGGRSINLAISHRGLSALERVGAASKVLERAVPMRGRMIHGPSGERHFQPYGTRADHTIHSISRGGLNALLLETAAVHENVRLFFHRKCVAVDLDAGEIELLDTQNESRSVAKGDILIAADGAFSILRRTLQKLDRFNASQEYLEHGYKELVMPSGPDGTHRMERNALHIWPRRSFMMIALPNEDGSFTCTLFWPFEGPCSFAAVQRDDEITSFFGRHFPDAVPLMPTLADEYLCNPVGSLVTTRCWPWHHRGRAVLLGDAAHAVVPFYGQGANAAFEDVLVLAEHLERLAPDWDGAFAAYARARKVHCDALAELAIGNFLEMRDHTGSRWFLLKKKTETLLHRLMPWWYVPLYTLVTFTRTPYAQAVARARRQNRVVGVVCGVLLLALLLTAGILLR